VSCLGRVLWCSRAGVGGCWAPVWGKEGIGQHAPPWSFALPPSRCPPAASRLLLPTPCCPLLPSPCRRPAHCDGGAAVWAACCGGGAAGPPAAHHPAGASGGGPLGIWALGGAVRASDPALVQDPAASHRPANACCLDLWVSFITAMAQVHPAGGCLRLHVAYLQAIDLRSSRLSQLAQPC